MVELPYSFKISNGKFSDIDLWKLTAYDFDNMIQTINTIVR